MSGTLSYKQVRTRKPHRCWGCRSEIPKATLAWVTVWTDGGAIGRTYWCDICDSIMRDSVDDMVCEGELTEQAEEVRLLLVDALNSVMRQAIQK